ncbi:MAG: hypothetical protein II719_00265 [Clostridia bacterium]|nr:hypothetical protein [Clostridia bacterium]
MKKRTLLIAGLILAAAAVSCGEAAPAEPVSTEPLSSAEDASAAEGTESGTEEATEPATEDTELKNWAVYTVYPEPNIPEDLDLSGKTFSIGMVTDTPEMVVPESLNGEIINDAVFNRNLKVQERFGVRIRILPDNDLRTIVSAGLSEFDLVYGLGEGLAGTIPDGYGRDFCGLPYVDFTEPFWFPDLMGQFSCFGKMFLAPSDIMYDFMANTEVTFFNKRLISEYDLESPYQMVRDNTWTFDNFLEMVRKVSKDLNGDGIMDDNDLYGLGLHDGRILGTFISLLVGAETRVTVQDPDRGVYFDPDAEKIQSMIDRAGEVLKDRSLSFDNDAWSRQNLPEGQYYTPFFDQGQILFQMDYLSVMQGARREMEDDFGIVPVPKYDAAQKTYHHEPTVLSFLFCLPTTSVDDEKTGAVFSYLSWLSNQTVIPAYYEVTLKQKRTRDEESAEMLDLIHRTTYFSFGYIWTDIKHYLALSFEAGNYERLAGSALKKLTKTLDKRLNKLRDLD